MNTSLDGFVDHDRFAPDAGLFQHSIDHMGLISACLYGRRLYELMSGEQTGRLRYVHA